MLQSKNVSAFTMLRIVAALGLALALAACSDSGPSQSDLDKAEGDASNYKMQAEGLQGQITAAMMALSDAGAVGATLADQVADIVSKVSQGTMDLETANGAINAAVMALQGAGLAGADLATLVAAAIVDVNELAEMEEKERMKDEAADRKNWAALHDLLATLNANEVDSTTNAAIPQPDEGVMKADTKADPTPTAWAALYNPTAAGKAMITMTATTDDRTNGSWPQAVIPGRSISSDADGNLSASGTFRDVAGTFTCAASATCGAALTFDKDGGVTNASDAGAGWMFEATEGLAAMIPVPDPDYVEYGYWLTKNDDDEPTGFNVFYNGVGAYATAVVLPAQPAADADAITANYAGDAAGKYLVRDSNGDATAGPGYFTATATLKAVINPTGADGNAYTVSGEISEFMDDGAMPMGDLVVTLNDGDPDTA